VVEDSRVYGYRLDFADPVYGQCGPRSWRIGMKKYIVRLEAEERSQLDQIVRTGKRAA
jgi:hypothetical protein